MSRILTSWKEIAQYFGKGVRTVQRWQQMYGLPVRRAVGNDHRAVLAVPEELDRWIHAQSVSPPSELDTLRHEVIALRAENESLRQQLAQSTIPAPPDGDLLLDYDLLIRSAQLIREAAELREHTAQLHSRTRVLATQLKKMSAFEYWVRSLHALSSAEPFSTPPSAEFADSSAAPTVH